MAKPEHVVKAGAVRAFAFVNTIERNGQTVPIRKEFLTGTAITIIIALLFLLAKPRGEGGSLFRHCPVCDHRLLRGKYCSECGSKV